MKPTAYLRINRVKNEGVTAEMVHAEREKTGDPLMTCKARLVAEKRPVLQQWWIFDNDFDKGQWLDVETTVNGDVTRPPSY